MASLEHETALVTGARRGAARLRDVDGRQPPPFQLLADVTGEESSLAGQNPQRLVPEHAERVAEKLDESGFGA